MPDKKTIDPATQEMIAHAKAKGVSTAFERAETMKPCPIGHEGACCKHCFMGPCRIVGKTTMGICGATHDTITARNLARAVAAGAASHSDHGRNMAMTLIAVAQGKAQGYTIKDVKKLNRVAALLGVQTGERSKEDIALDAGRMALNEFGRQEGELIYLGRAPLKRQQIWRSLGIAPRGIDREVSEMMHRTHMGSDQDAEHLLLQAMRCALADGWGGSMLATDIGDIVFGTPSPVSSQSNFGVIREDEVNIAIHGHEPNLAETLVALSQDPDLLSYAKSKGANGINLMGMCCSGNELLARHGVPIVGNLSQTDLAITTGALEAVVVDYQCIMQGLQLVSESYHTKVITTSPKVKIKGAMHIEFDEHRANEIGKLILRTAIDNFTNRKEVYIPDVVNNLVAGFSHEYIAYMQGGSFRESFRPLNDAVMQGRIRGAAGVAGCNNLLTAHDEAHVNIIKELIKNDVLVVTTGCNAVACAKYGLLTGEVMEYAGHGLREVCNTIGIPPVLHVGSCVDNSRILTILTQMATEGGLGEDIADLPVFGVAPEWMSEKALTIGTYFAASGVYTIFGVGSPVASSPEVIELMTQGWQEKVGGSLEFEPDWHKTVEKGLAYIDAKRKTLKLDTYNPKRFARSETYLPGDIYPFAEYAKGSYKRP